MSSASGKKNRLKMKYPMKLWPLRPATRAGQKARAIQIARAATPMTNPPKVESAITDIVQVVPFIDQPGHARLPVGRRRLHDGWGTRLTQPSLRQARPSDKGARQPIGECAHPWHCEGSEGEHLRHGVRGRGLG